MVGKRVASKDTRQGSHPWCYCCVIEVTARVTQQGTASFKNGLNGRGSFPSNKREGS